MMWLDVSQLWHNDCFRVFREWKAPRAGRRRDCELLEPLFPDQGGGAVARPRREPSHCAELPAALLSR